MENLLSKIELRSHLKKLRSSLQADRREEASSVLLFQLLPKLDPFKSVLSFASFSDEIDTALINLYLARSGKLALPRISGESLEFFMVSNPHGHLIPNTFGLLEPNPKFCRKIEPCYLDSILVPALGFDHRNHRIGYGGGFYDRFLKFIPEIQTIGIGFKEQLIPLIPSHDFDIPLEKVYLF
jgi:5-formyltetrahydrofolate cyclo-ligase